VAVALGLAQTVAWACTYYLPAVLAAPVAEELGAPRTAVVGAFSAALLIAGLCAPRVGRAIEARGGRGVLVASSFVLAAGLALLGLLPGIAGWCAGWAVLGLGMAMGLYDAAFATLGRLYGREARRPITQVTLIAGFASTVGWPVSTALLPQLGWRGTCLAYAAAQILLVLPLYLALVPSAAPPPAPGEDGARPERAEAPRAAPAAHAAWMRRAVLMLGAFFTLRAVVGAAMSVHLIALLEGIGLGLAAAVAVASLVGPSQVAGRMLEFAFARRAHPLTVARLGALALPLGVALLLAPGPLAIAPAAAAFAVCYGISNGLLTISRGAVPLALFGPRGYATLLGRLAMPVLIAQAIAPTLAAPAVEGLPAAWTFALSGALAGAALLCLVPLRPVPPGEAWPPRGG
ncbi:MFS transporter, partial [Caldovatus aquaticus]